MMSMPLDNENERKEWRHKKRNLLIYGVTIVSSVVFIIIGSVLLKTCGPKFETSEQIIDYTNCTRLYLRLPKITCAEYMKTHLDSCQCLQYFNFTLKPVGDVMLYYMLDEFDQSKYAKSRDDDQLSGHLSNTVSPDCGPFNYTREGTPIAPCGALADVMFNDTYEMQWRHGEMIVFDSSEDGIIEDKGFYHNPPGNESLEVLFQNYSKPINWVNNIWELSTNRNSNGFENERFIGWMNTNLKRKPALRINPINSKIPKNSSNEYALWVGYSYPTTLYSGPRKVILTATQLTEEYSTAKYVIGIILVLLGVICFVAMNIVLVIYLRKKGWQWHLI